MGIKYTSGYGSRKSKLRGAVVLPGFSQVVL